MNCRKALESLGALLFCFFLLLFWGLSIWNYKGPLRAIVERDSAIAIREEKMARDAEDSGNPAPRIRLLEHQLRQAHAAGAKGGADQSALDEHIKLIESQLSAVKRRARHISPKDRGPYNSSRDDPAWHEFDLGSLLQIARDPAVQEELQRLDAMGLKEFNAVVHDYYEDVRIDIGQHHAHKTITSATKVEDNRLARFLNALKQSLSAEQFTRLQQIVIQVKLHNRPSAVFLNDEWVSKRIDLSNEQRRLLSEIENDFRNKEDVVLTVTKRRRRYLLPPASPEEQSKLNEEKTQFAELEKARDAKAMEVLNEKQLKILDDLKGIEFDISAMNRFLIISQ